MKDEYIIINKTAIQKKIEELERLYRGCEKPSIQGTLHNKLIVELKQILSQSIPLIPEIEKAFDEGVCSIQENNGKLKVKMPKAKQDYISNLKLDI